MNSALVAGELETALTFLTERAQAQYGPIFAELSSDMPGIVAGYSALKPSLISEANSEYGVNRTVDGVNRVFLLGFGINELGQWQLDSM